MLIAIFPPLPSCLGGGGGGLPPGCRCHLTCILGVISFLLNYWFPFHFQKHATKIGGFSKIFDLCLLPRFSNLFWLRRESFTKNKHCVHSLGHKHSQQQIFGSRPSAQDTGIQMKRVITRGGLSLQFTVWSGAKRKRLQFGGCSRKVEIFLGKNIKIT